MEYQDTGMWAGNVLVYQACLVISLGVMLFALGGRGTGWLTVRPMTYIGKISYSMYLVHMGMILVASTMFHGLTAATVAFALTVVYGALSWTLWRVAC